MSVQDRPKSNDKAFMSGFAECWAGRRRPARGPVDREQSRNRAKDPAGIVRKKVAAAAA
jgi:hypothetical protein